MGSPFDYEHADPWADDFVDVESINAHVTDHLVAKVEAVRVAALRGGQDLRSSSTLILGPAGSGKTHLFARLRKKCGERAAFVLVRPEVGVLPTPRQMLAQVVDALQKHVLGTDKRQIDVVVGALLAALDGSERWPLVALDDLRASADREERVEHVLERLEELHEDVAPCSSYLRRLLLLPFAVRQERYALLQFLSGREPEEAQLRRLKLTRGLADEDIVPSLRALAIVAAFGAPVVILFDQLENLVGDDGERIHAHARLYADLFDPPMRGLVLAQMALDREWQDRIRPRLSEAERTRLESNTLSLSLPSPEQRDALVREWGRRLGPHVDAESFPFPFTRAAWSEWRERPGVTPRMLLLECRERLAIGGAEPAGATTPEEEEAALVQRLEVEWEEHLARTRAVLDEATGAQRALDEWKLVSGARACLGLAEGLVIVSARAPAQFSTRRADRETAFVVLQEQNGSQLAKALKKCAAVAGARSVRVLRESRLVIRPTWKACITSRRDLLALPNVAWVNLDHDATTRLLTMHDFLASARSGDLTDAAGRPIPEGVATAWARKQLAENPAWVELCANLLSDPRQAANAAPAEVEPADEANLDVDAVLAALRRLHLASVDRLVRELRTSEASATQAGVMSALTAAHAKIRWLGRTIVCLAEIAS
jgi:hypothetical protein